VKFVDFRFWRHPRQEQHVTGPFDTVDESLFTEGKMSTFLIAGWKGINESDMI